MMKTVVPPRIPRRAFIGGFAAVLALGGCIGESKPATIGTRLDGRAAPDFTLVDFWGRTVSLSDQQGSLSIVTFVFTTCPDVCPLIAENLRATLELLPPDVIEKVAMLAVTVDPERDTPAMMQDFAVRHGLDLYPRWHGLGGERTELEPIWVAYGIDPGLMQEEIDRHTTGQSRPMANSHTDAVYIIDKDGGMQALLRSDFDPEELAQFLKSTV